MLMFQRVKFGLSLIFFVSGYYTRDISDATSNGNDVKITKMNSQSKLNISTIRNESITCSCGDYGHCEMISEKKLCNCFDYYADLNGICEECNCSSLGLCIFNKDGDKTCDCIRNASEKNGTCRCVRNTSEKNGKCEECNCENGDCSFVDGQKKCDCPSNFSELDGICTDCDCTVGNCSFVNGQKRCDCPSKFSELDGICTDCDCGVGNCSFYEGVKTCDCPSKYSYIDGICKEGLHKCENPETCKNGGNCIEAGNDFTCVCANGFTGKDCSGTLWCEENGGLACGNVPCKYDPASNRSFCNCGEAKYLDVKSKECKKINECLKLQLDEKCLSPNEICRKGICFCEKGYEYTKNNETCVTENTCTDDHKRKSCSEISALCVEDLDLESGFKCICDDGYVKDSSKNETCSHKCNLESNIEKCLHSLSLCELDGKYNAKCGCPPMFTEGPTKICNKRAEYSVIDTFQILKKPYEVFRYPDMLTSVLDYTTLAKNLKEALSSVFKYYKDSKILNCTENPKDLKCTVELQLTKLPGEELNLIFTPSVCLPMTNPEYCLIPPRLILRNKQNAFKKTDPCDDVVSTSLCGSSTNCELLKNKRDFQCKCKQGFIPTGAYLPFSGNKEAVIQRCIDINECLEDGACPESTYCVNRIGSYDCYCTEGFRQNIDVDIKVEGCLGICNPNPCMHGICNLTGTDGFACNCEPSYTGFKCDEPIALITDIQSSASKFLIIIGGTLGSALIVAVLVCITLIVKNRKQALKVEEEGKKYELRRRQWIESQRERLETRNVRETRKTHETIPKICAEQENSNQRQYQQHDSRQDVRTNVQVYHQDYIQRALAKSNMGISYQRIHSNDDILYVNAVIHQENEESIHDADNGRKHEIYARRIYHDPKETHNTSLDLQTSRGSNDDFYYTTMPSGVDVRHGSELGRSNTEVESKIWEKHNDAKKYKKNKSSPTNKTSNSFKEGIRSSRVSHESYKDVAVTEPKQNQFAFSVDKNYKGDKVAKNKINDDYELRTGKDIKKMGSNQHKPSKNIGMQNSEAYEEDEIMI